MTTINTVAAAAALSSEQITALKGSDLAAVYNLLTEGEEVKRFATRADGVKRVTRLVAAAREATKIRESDPNVKSWNEMTNALAKHTAPAKANGSSAGSHEIVAVMAKRAGEASLNRLKERASSKRSKAAVIRLIAKSNPCRPGTGHYDRFELYRDGMTVADYVKAGGRIGDVYGWDEPHGFICVEK